jgi:uncharacterized membrane protein YjjB (DUF3815 family)
MNKQLIYLLAGVGGIIGAYVPVWLFHQSDFSIASILGSGLGGIIGIWLAVKLQNSM